MNRFRLVAVIALCASNLVLPQARAQVVAEALLVNLDFTTLSEGPLTNVVNTGTMGGVFETRGRAALEIPRIARPGGGTGTRALLFDGVDHMQHVVAAGVTNLISAAPGLTGANPTRTIEAWVFNPTLQDEETILAWGRRGGVAGNNMSFNYGTSAAYGAIGHWGAPDVGWYPAVGAPAAGVWHHLVYTLDGATTRVYVDGQLTNAKATTVNTLPLPPIALGAQNTSDAGALDNTLRGALAIGRVRIHDGVLAPADVLANYNLEAASFTVGEAVPLSVRPRNRYSFNNPAAADATGAVITDSEGGAHGEVRGAGAGFSGTRLLLPGGASATQAYVDLPNGLVSSISAANGGTGRLTVEGWVIPRGSRSWSRLFDFGIGTAGEITGPGGSATGLDHFMLTHQIGTDLTRKLLEVKNDNGQGGPAGVDGTTMESSGLNTSLHFAVTWDESSGRVRYYENGFLVSDFITNKSMSHIQDVNVWLGRSSWTADANLQADYDEFRVYNEALTPGEIRNNFVYGPDTVFVAPGPLQSLSITLPRSNPFLNTWQKPAVRADFQNVSNVDLSNDPAAVLSTDDPGIAAFNAARELRAIALGATTARAVYGGMTATVAVTVVPESAVLTHRYSFDGNANDSVGGAHGTLAGSPVFSDGAISLSAATQDHVRLPAGILAGHYAVSVEAWASIATSGAWARLFDFGATNLVNQGRNYILYSPRSGSGGQRLAIANADPGNLNEGALNLPASLENQGMTHIVCVVHSAGRRLDLYLNGSLAGSVTNLTQALSGVTDTVNFLGRSLYAADAYLNGSIAEFRIYDGVLTPARVAFGLTAGPDQLPPANEGALTGVRVSGPASLGLHQTADYTLLGDYENLTGVNLELTQTPGYVLLNPGAGVATLSPTGLLQPVRPGATTIQGSFGGFTNQLPVVISRLLPLDLAHRYPFDGNANDVINGAHGSLVNNNGNAFYQNGVLNFGNIGNEASSGTGGNFVDLPNGIISALGSNATFEAWFTWDPDANTGWQRLFDFGNSDGGEDISSSGAQSRYLFYTPRSGGAGGAQVVGFNEYANGVRTERRITGATIAPSGAPVHLVFTWNAVAQQTALYIDGALIGTVAPHIPLSGLVDINNWLGRSQFGGDPYFSGSLDEFRIYRGPMSAGDVADSLAAGPSANGAFNVALAGRPAAVPGQVRIAWPNTISPAYILQASDTLPAVWFDLNLPVVEEAGERFVVDPTPLPYRVYRLRKP